MSREIDKACGIKRAHSEELDAVLGWAFPVLDHGFVRVIDYMGVEDSIVQGARVSYGNGTKKTSEDAGLIRYLLRHRHTSPFELCEIKFHIKLPIFVARQWIRHRTANVNEYSGRYSIMDKEFYVPNTEHLAAQSTTNKQGRGAILTGDEATRALEILKEDAAKAYEHYEELLNVDEDGNVKDPDKQGLARELARMNLPVNFYTQWYWKIDLHNLMHFLSLRADAHAQYEIRVYAEVMLGLLKAWMPTVYAAFMDYRVGTMQLTEPEIAALRYLLTSGTPIQEFTPEQVIGYPRLSGREAGEFKEKAAKLFGENL